jgi:hypothetical protein
MAGKRNKKAEREQDTMCWESKLQMTRTQANGPCSIGVGEPLSLSLVPFQWFGNGYTCADLVFRPR